MRAVSQSGNYNLRLVNKLAKPHYIEEEKTKDYNRYKYIANRGW